MLRRLHECSVTQRVMVEMEAVVMVINLRKRRDSGSLMLCGTLAGYRMTHSGKFSNSATSA